MALERTTTVHCGSTNPDQAAATAFVAPEHTPALRPGTENPGES
jgi:hypothetical protein